MSLGYSLETIAAEVKGAELRKKLCGHGAKTQGVARADAAEGRTRFYLRSTTHNDDVTEPICPKCSFADVYVEVVRLNMMKYLLAELTKDLDCGNLANNTPHRLYD